MKIFTISNIKKVIRDMNRGRDPKILTKMEEGLKESEYNSYVSLPFFSIKLNGNGGQPLLLKNTEYYPLANKIANDIDKSLVINDIEIREKDWGSYPATTKSGYKRISAKSSYIPKGWEYKLHTELQINGNSETVEEFRVRAIIALTTKVLEALRFNGLL